eukprot:317336-Rhodomonas_salina.3
MVDSAGAESTLPAVVLVVVPVLVAVPVYIPRYLGTRVSLYYSQPSTGMTENKYKNSLLHSSPAFLDGIVPHDLYQWRKQLRHWHYRQCAESGYPGVPGYCTLAKRDSTRLQNAQATALPDW